MPRTPEIIWDETMLRQVPRPVPPKPINRAIDLERAIQDRRAS